MIKPEYVEQITETTVRNKAIGAEAQVYLGSISSFPASAYAGQYLTYTTSPYGIYQYSNSSGWVKQTAPTNSMIANAAYDIMNAVNEGHGTIDDYIGSGVNFKVALISYLFANYIKILTGGSIYGGDRYKQDGTDDNTSAAGFWLGANGIFKAAQAIFSGKVEAAEFTGNVNVGTTGSICGGGRYSSTGTVINPSGRGWWLGGGDNSGFYIYDKNLNMTFLKSDGTVVGGWNADNVLFDTTDYNVSLGYDNIPYTASGNNNIAIGQQNLKSLTSGIQNIALGLNLMPKITTGYTNISLGTNNIAESASAYSNIAIGQFILSLSTATQASDNIFMGNYAGAHLASSSTQSILRNIAIGNYALEENITAPKYNIAIGYESQKNSQGQQNTTIGGQTLTATTNASYNVAIGENALEKNLGDYNVAVGKSAMGYHATGNSNIGIGAFAMYNSTDQDYSVAVGEETLINASGGSCNTAIGYKSLLLGTTVSKATGLGYYAGSNATSQTNITCLGANAQITGSNQVQLGDSATTTYAYGAVQDRSDARDKADIRDTILGLNFIKKLRPVDFRWNYREDYTEYETTKDENGEEVRIKKELPNDGSKKRSRFHHGIIAQEVKKVMDELGIDFGGYQDHKVKGGKDVLTIGYEELIAPMIKAIQEQQTIIETLEKRIDELEGKM